MANSHVSDLYGLLYCSHATQAMGPCDIERIVASAQRNNPQMEITGVLVYGGGMFLQWLEGPYSQVRELINTLRQDPRHDCLLELHTIYGVSDRLYPSWDMHWVEPSEILEVLRDAAARTTHPKHAQAIELLQQLLESSEFAALST
jgi:Sensors of blue-light using FAD